MCTQDYPVLFSVPCSICHEQPQPREGYYSEFRFIRACRLTNPSVLVLYWYWYFCTFCTGTGDTSPDAPTPSHHRQTACHGLRWFTGSLSGGKIQIPFNSDVSKSLVVALIVFEVLLGKSCWKSDQITRWSCNF